MVALTLDTAKNLALAGAAAFAVAALASAWIVKSIVQKLVMMGVLGLLAFAVFSQRTALQDCADKVRGNFQRVGSEVTVVDTDCSFFGMTVTISDPRDDDA